MANVKKIVNHDRLYMSVNGKLKHIKRGTAISVSEKQLESKHLASKLIDANDDAPVDVSASNEALAAAKAADAAMKAAKAASKK